MGNMFYREQPINAIREADYDDLKYFNAWHEAMSRAEVKAANDAKGKRT